MAPRTPKRVQKQQLLGNHQKCWVWGKNVVLETLRAGRWPILELRIADRLDQSRLDEVRQLAGTRDVPVVVESAAELERRCRSSEHQGYAAKMPPFPYDDVDAVLREEIASPLYLILDSIQDPYNFGAILRSAEVFGVDGVFVPERGNSEVTSLVARTSAGAVNYVRLAKVRRLEELVQRLRGGNVSVVAATQNGSTPVAGLDFRRATAIIIGNEGEGIRDTLLQQCDSTVRIPQHGSVESLNAAVSAGIVLYEAAKQRTESAFSKDG